VHPRDIPPTPSAVTALWAAYIAVLPFHRVWRLPWFDLKLQPPEIVFVGLAVASVVVCWRRRMDWRFTFADVAVPGWVAANVLALLLAKQPIDREAEIEALAAAYLAGLYAAIRITATPRLLDRFSEWFSYSAMAAAALGIAGVVAAWMGQPTRLATVVVLPYLGGVARAQALTTGPGMLSSILLMAVPLFVGSRMGHVWRRRDTAGLLLLVIGITATVSKTALCLAAALSVMWACGPAVRDIDASRRSRVRWWAASAVSLAVVVMMAIGSHVMVMRRADIANLSSAQLVGGRPFASFHWNDESWVLMPTTYTFNNEASLLAIERSWPIGLGPAGQPAFTASLQRDGQFPPSILMRTPHSTYLGAAAERGVAGAVALVALLVAAGITIQQLLAQARKPDAPFGVARSRWQVAAYAGAGTGFLIEALSTDLLNCRHYWLLLAIVVARLNAERGDGPLYR
jgi:hypothetical protein